MVEKPAFLSEWRSVIATVAFWTWVFYVVGLPLAAVLGAASAGDLSITDLSIMDLPLAVLGAVGAVFWATWYFCLTGWVIVLTVSLSIALVRYVRAQRAWHRAG
jgi:hypothetical protein